MYWLLIPVLLVAQEESAPSFEKVEPAKVLKGHEASVYDVAFSPDGKLLASASFDKTLKVWNRESGKEIATLRGHGEKVMAVAFSPDGRWILSGSQDKTLKLWKTPVPGVVPFFKSASPVTALFVPPGGERVVAGTQAGVVLVADAKTGKFSNMLEGLEGPVTLVASDAAGQTVLAAAGNKARLWLAPGAAAPKAAPEAPPVSPPPADLLPAGASWKIFKGKAAPPAGWASAGFDDSGWEAAASGFGYSNNPEELATVKTRLDDMAGGGYLTLFARGRFEIEDPKRVEKLALEVLYDDGFVAYLNGEEVARRNVEGNPPPFDRGAQQAGEPQKVEIDLTDKRNLLKPGANVLAIQGHNAGPQSSDFVLTPVLRGVLAAPEPPREPPPKPKEVVEVFGPTAEPVGSLAVSPSGKSCAVAAGPALIVRKASGEKWEAKLPAKVTALVFLDDTALAVGLENGRVEVRKLGEENASRAIEAHEGAVTGLASAGDLLASSGADGKVRLWKLEDGSEARSWTAHEGGVQALAVAGQEIITGGREGAVRVWNAAEGKEAAAFTLATAASAVGGLGGGRYLAAQGGGVLLLRPVTLEAVKTLSGHGGLVHAVAFSPDGKIAASASSDKTVRLWDVAEGKQIRAINAHDSSVYTVAFSPDGRFIASGGYDRVIKLWKTADGSEVRKFEGHEEGIFCLAFSPDGSLLFSGSSDRTVRKWNVADGKELAKWEAHPGWLSGMALFENGTRLLSVDYGGHLLVREVESGKIVQARRVGVVVYDLALTADGKWVATANEDGTVFLLGN